MESFAAPLMPPSIHYDENNNGKTDQQQQHGYGPFFPQGRTFVLSSCKSIPRQFTQDRPTGMAIPVGENEFRNPGITPKRAENSGPGELVLPTCEGYTLLTNSRCLFSMNFDAFSNDGSPLSVRPPESAGTIS
jgi:hypothetical protein